MVDADKITNDLKLHNEPGIIVANFVHCQIVKTDIEGSIWHSFGSMGNGTGEFNGTYGVDYDTRTGFCYVADIGNHRIVKTKLDGTGWTTFGTKGNGTGQFNEPSDINYDISTGFMYILDSLNHRIVRTKMDGTGWAEYGTKGFGKGQFHLPFKLSFDKSTGYIYVADCNNSRIVRTKINGTGWKTYGTYGNGTGQFHRPTGISYDKKTDFIYITDRYNNRIVRTKIDGTGWTTFGSYGNGVGNFNYSDDIEYNSKTGFVYVADSVNNRIVKTMMNGSGWTTYGIHSKIPGVGKFYLPAGVKFIDHSYRPEGYLISNPINCSKPSNFMNISWNAQTPVNTSVKFQIRTAMNESNILINDFIGPDGTNNTYYSTSKTTIWSGHNGDKWIQYKVYLSTSDYSQTPVLKNIAISYNVLPDVPILMEPENNSFVIEDKPLFSWTFIDQDSNAQGAFQWQVDNDIGFDSVEYDSQVVISNNLFIIPEESLADGIWYWRLKVMDAEGGWGRYSGPFKFTLDTGIPSSKIIIPKNNTYYRELEIIYGTAFEPPGGTRLDKVELQIEDLDYQKFWDGSVWTSSENWLIPDGKEIWSYDVSNIEWTSETSYKIHSRAIDIAGNIESPAQTKEFTFDDEGVMFSKPIPEIHQISIQEEVQVGITISDNTSGVNSSTIKYSTSTDAGNYWGPWKSLEGFENGNNVDVKLNLTFPNGTGNRIRWRAYDISGNGPTYSDEYAINVNIPKPPIIPDIKLTAPVNNSKLTTTSVKLTWEVIKNYCPRIVFDIKIGITNPPQEVIEQDYTDTKLIVDELENSKTYYWTVIPKLNNVYGTCISDIWSFTVDIPLPRAILKTPENNSIMTSTLPTLVWSLDYEGTELISYDIYFGTNKDPPLEHEKLSTTYFAIDTALQDNTTYYWKIVPSVGEYEGFSSEIWSFKVKLEDEKILKFAIELDINPNPLEIKPGEVKFVSAIVTNLGEQKDNFTIQIDDINNTKLTAENYRQDTLEIEPGKNKEFLIMVSIKDGTEPGFENITITAKSKLADKYNVDVKDSHVLTIEILEKDEQNGKERGQPISIFYFSILLLIIILIIISIIILIIVRKKSSKKDNKEIETQDIQPGTSPKSNIIPEPETTIESLPVGTQQQDETLEE